MIITEAQQGRTIVARLKPGQEVVFEIHKILKQKKITSGYMPVIVGGFKKLRLISMRSADDENQPVSFEKSYTEPLEYFGMGTIAQNAAGEPSIHVHLSAARAENKGLTGHLVFGEVVLLTEIVIVELTGVTMVRKPDPNVYNVPLLSFE